MSEKKLNVALIGCGQIASTHIPAILAKKECNLYAICDSATDDRMQKAMEKVGMPDFCKEHAFTDYRDLVDDPNIDIAVIITDDYTHCEITCAFLRAGKDVLLEKPMALNNEECAIMRQAEKESGRRLMVGQVGRYANLYKKAKALVSEGAIGELVYVEGEYAHDYKKSRGYADWRVTPQRNGMIGGGCHAVDFLRWIAGDPEEVFAYSNHKYLTDWPANDTTIAVFKFPNNVIGKIFCSIGVKRNKANRFCLYGTEGTIIGENGQDLKLFQVDKNGNNFTFPKLVPYPHNSHNMTGEFSDFVDALLQNRPCPISSHDGASTVAVCCAAVEAAQKGQPVKIVYPEA